MWRIFFSLFALLAFFPTQVYAEEGWMINSFDSNIQIQKDGKVHVVETIKVNYSLSKHGIYRDLPYVYQKGDEKYYTNVVIGSVERDSRKEKYTVSSNDANLQVKIGDPDRTISGAHTYTIDYSITGVIRPFQAYDELYWNVTGNGWGVPITSASARVTMPTPIILGSACYVGYSGSTQPCVKDVSSESATFTAVGLTENQGLTVAVGFKKGVIPIILGTRPPTFLERLLTPLNVFLFLLPIIAVSIFIFQKWYTQGRDSWTRGKHLFDKQAREEVKPIGAHETIVVEYTPPDNLRPAELGVLMDQKADTLDVTSTIIDLAGCGFLKIREIPKKWLFGKVDYELTQTKKTTVDLLEYEKFLIDRLFTTGNKVQLSSLKNTFYDDLKLIKSKLYADVIEKKLFPHNPDSVRSSYLALGILIAALCFFVIFWVPGISTKVFLAGFISSAFIILIFSRVMPRRTAQGRELYRRAKGYYEFIAHVERYRQPFFEKRNMFNEVLPYAIIFGLTEKFARAMRDMGVKTSSPTWYSGTHPFNTVAFGSSVNSFSTSLSTAMSSTPSSSGSGGGGSSGGGFGGGGGGSW